MDYNMPERPRSFRRQEISEIIVGGIVFFTLVFFLLKGVNAVFPDGESFINRLFTAAAVCGSLAVGASCVKAMRRSYDKTCLAWEQYWDKFYVDKYDLERELRLNKDESKQEKLEKQVKKAQDHYNNNFYWLG